MYIMTYLSGLNEKQTNKQIKQKQKQSKKQNKTKKHTFHSQNEQVEWQSQIDDMIKKRKKQTDVEEIFFFFFFVIVFLFIRKTKPQKNTKNHIMQQC